MDIDMPLLNGFKASQQILEFVSKLPGKAINPMIVAHTAYWSSENQQTVNYYDFLYNSKLNIILRLSSVDLLST